MARHGERRQEPEAQIYAENRQRALPGGPTVSTEPQGRAGVSEQLFVVAAPPPSDRAACERRFRSNRVSNPRNRGRNGAAIRLPTARSCCRCDTSRNRRSFDKPNWVSGAAATLSRRQSSLAPKRVRFLCHAMLLAF